MEMFLTYDDALEIVSEYIQKQVNLSAFCKEHNLCYRNVLAIKSKSDCWKYGNLIQKILEIMGNKVEKLTCFRISQIDPIKKGGITQ